MDEVFNEVRLKTLADRSQADDHSFNASRKSESHIAFQRELQGLDFEEEPMTISGQGVALPSEAPQSPQWSESSKTQAKSQVIESLISQNEDLMSRLKVTLRRLSLTEEECQSAKDNWAMAQQELNSYRDQLLIWKEKERIWQSRIADLEGEVNDFRARFPDFEKMEDKILRFERYQERIKSQVKPYVQQLKSYAESLALQIQNLRDAAEEKDVQIENIKDRLQRERDEWTLEYHRLNQSKLDQTHRFESDREALMRELEFYKSILPDLTEKADRLNEIILKNDELGNQIISLQRTIADKDSKLSSMQNSVADDLKKLTDQLSIAKALNREQEKVLRNQDQELAKVRQESQERLDQLLSTRLLWNQQSAENEKMKLANQALEKINKDLSYKMQELRERYSAAKT